MDSSDTKITYRAILERAAQDAREYAPEFPKENTFDAWEEFQNEVDCMDSYEIASESSGWDWVIYYARAMELCIAVPSDVLSDAEDTWEEYGAYTGDKFTLHGFACTLAGIIVEREIVDAVESLKEELIDLAETEKDKL